MNFVLFFVFYSSSSLGSLFPLHSLVVQTQVSVSPPGDSIAETEVLPKMDARFAESLVRKWQNIKSEALGPDHCLGKLSEVKIYFLYIHVHC